MSSKPQPQLEAKARAKTKAGTKTGTTPNPGLQHLSAILSAVVAFLTIITWLFTQSTTISRAISTWWKGHSSSSSYIVEEVSYPEVVPSYLRYYYEAEGLGEKESLHWFRAKMRNNTRERLNFVGSFDLFPINCEFVQLRKGDAPDPYVLEPGADGPWEVTPALVWTKVDSPDPCFLKFTYSIQDDRGDKPDPIGSVQIKVLPRDKVKWDLENINGKPVSKDFILASLAGWSLSREGNVIERALQLRTNVTGLAAEQWLRLCYENLFGRQSGLRITPTAATYPFKDVTTLRAPGDVLSGRSAEPLEAAFLMAAVTRFGAPGRIPLTLFVLPGPNDANPAVLLAWSSTNDARWEAIDLTEANILSFGLNLQHSQQLLQRTLRERPEMLQALTMRGVFYGSATRLPTAISLDTAIKNFQILALQ
jgi:hypothetical protein